MSSPECATEFKKERITETAEGELDERRLLDITWKPDIKPHSTGESHMKPTHPHHSSALD